LVYSITSRQSFEFTLKLRTNVMRMKNEDHQFPMVLAGNKKDLASERQVSESEGKDQAEKFGVPFLETSAKTNENVNQVFFSLVRQINSWRKNHPNKKGKEKKGKCQII